MKALRLGRLAILVALAGCVGPGELFEAEPVRLSLSVDESVDQVTVSAVEPSGVDWRRLHLSSDAYVRWERTGEATGASVGLPPGLPARMGGPGEVVRVGDYVEVCSPSGAATARFLVRDVEVGVDVASFAFEDVGAC